MKKTLNSIKSTNFNNLKNKEQMKDLKKVFIQKKREKKSFFNLGFNNRWKKYYLKF